MAKNKTIPTQSSVIDFLNAVDDEVKKNDSFELIKIMQEQSGFEPKMWGPSIIGFGSYHYQYDSGHQGDAPLIGFSPRKEAISLYLFSCLDGKEELLAKFGKFKKAKSCLYIKKLADIDIEILKKMIVLSIQDTKKLYPQK